MNIKGVLRNLKNKGVAETIKLGINRVVGRRHTDQYLKQLQLELQAELSKYDDPKEREKELKRLCIKELIPATYDK